MKPKVFVSLFLYTADPDDVMGKPQNWALRHELRRPWAVEGFQPDRQLNMNFYGYPTIAPISEDDISSSLPSGPGSTVTSRRTSTISV